MSRKRMIDPSFWNDEKIADIPPEARLLFIGMWNFSDDEGILRLRGEYLKSVVFPYDGYSNEQIELWMEAIIKQNLIFPYLINGQKYGVIMNFLKHQVINKPLPSKLPKPSIQNSKYVNSIHERDGWICHLCGASTKDHVRSLRDPHFPSLDHLIPVSMGGEDMPYNLKTACLKCNKQRGNKPLPDNYGSDTEPLPSQMKGNKKKRNTKEYTYDENFLKFWNMYPKKVGKPKTFDLWNELSDTKKELIFIDLPKRMKDEKWVNGFIKDPERYIKNEQWEDDIKITSRETLKI